MLNDARRFLGSGQWRDALDRYAAAVADGAAEDVSLRLERLKAWDGLSDKPRALGELREIGRLVQSGELQPTPEEDAMVKLREADLIAGSGEDANERSDALLQEALEGPLPKAERDYAAGLLADTIDEAAGHFQATLERDPYHHRARVSLALTLILAGEAEEARRQVEVGAAIFPKDPAIRLIGAFGCAVRDQSAAARLQLEEAGEALSQGDRDAFLQVADIFEMLFRATDTEPLDTKVLARNALLRSVRVLLTLMEIQGRSSGPTLGAPPRFVREYVQNLGLVAYNTVGAAMGANSPVIQALLWPLGVRQLSDEEVEACFERAVRANPEALLLAIQGYWLWERGRIVEGEQALLAAIEAPSLLPPGLVHRKALSALISVDTSRLFDLSYVHPGRPDPVFDRWGNPVDPLELRGLLTRLREACLQCQGSVLLDSPALAHDIGQAAWLAGDLDLADPAAPPGTPEEPGRPRVDAGPGVRRRARVSRWRCSSEAGLPACRRGGTLAVPRPSPVGRCPPSRAVRRVPREILRGAAEEGRWRPALAHASAPIGRVRTGGGA
ncbi:MAG: tetratricopeptide repeat protein [Isosphaeraceae bacterium]